MYPESLAFLLEIVLGKDKKVTSQIGCISPNIWTVSSSQFSSNNLLLWMAEDWMLPDTL